MISTAPTHRSSPITPRHSTTDSPNSAQSFHPGSNSSETHTCPYNDCRKSFSKKYNLKAHLRLHTGEQPFECDRPDCKKKFKWRSSLSSHTIWHSRKDNGSIPPTPSSDHNNNTKSPSSRSSRQKSHTQASPSKPPTTTPPSWRSAASDRAHKSSKQPPAAANIAQNTTKRKRPRVDLSPPISTTPAPPLRAPVRPPVPAPTPALPCLSSNVSLHAISDRDASYCMQTIANNAPVEQYACETTSVGTAAIATSAKKEKVYQANDISDELLKDPGSPVTSDGDRSEKSLDAELFSVDLLPPLVGGDGEGLSLDADDVSTLLTGDGVSSLFGCSSPSCGTLNSLDTRFGPLDLDNMGLGLRKVEGL